MGLEIERKFLVKDNSYITLAVEKETIIQGYLSRNPNAIVRVRIAGKKAFITVKSKTIGILRKEWEYSIPLTDAREMLSLCKGLIEKERYKVPYAQYIWEIDVFKGSNSGLVVAEIELPSPNAIFELPQFIGEEVTGNPLYYNSNLSNVK